MRTFLFRLASLWVSLSLLASLLSCQQPLSVLASPLPASHVISKGLHVVLGESDLDDLGEWVRKSPGNRLITVPLPPLEVPGAQGYLLSSNVLHAEVGQGQGVFVSKQDVTLSWPVALQPLQLSLVMPGGGSCGLFFQVPNSAPLTVSLGFRRSAGGQALVSLAQGSKLTLEGASLGDPSGCLGAVAPGASSAIVAHVSGAVIAAVKTRYDAASVAGLRALLGVELEQSGQVELEISDQAIGLRLETRFVSPGPGLSPQGLFGHDGSYGRARLRVGLDVDRHACARDVPPPAVAPLSLAPVPPSVAPGGAVLRRTMVLDRALLSHFAWAVARAGVLCRGVERGIEVGLPASWASDVLPPLASWVGGGPVGARLWIGASPTVKVRDRAGGAGLEWVLPEALLEVSARVGDLELVVLSVTGQFRLMSRPVSLGAGDLSFEVQDASVDSALVSSPLLSAAPEPSELAVATLVRQALLGIFKPPLGFTGQAGVAKVIGTARDGESLWIWLDASVAPVDL